MKLATYVYKKLFKKNPPYWYQKGFLSLVAGVIRKWLTNSIASNCPINCIRIFLYRLSGFKIGKRTFIGMHCYLDDLCYKMLTIGDHVTISYGVYFACHGRNQPDYPIRVEDHAYIGMRASIISKNADGSDCGVTIGKRAVVGSCTLVNRDVPERARAVGVPCRILEDKEPSNG